MALKLLAEGPLASGGPVPLSPPRILAAVVGSPIAFVEGTYTEPADLIHQVFRDGQEMGELPYVPVTSDEGRDFIVLETALGARGFARQTTKQVAAVRRPVFARQPSFDPSPARIGQTITFDLGEAPGAELTVEYLTLDGEDDTDNLS